jgi:hypothetical protein
MRTKKQFLIFATLFAFLIFTSGCAVIHPQHRSKPAYHTNAKGKIPPGHKKKMVGTKSAAPFAPGQAKKHKKK